MRGWSWDLCVLLIDRATRCGSKTSMKLMTDVLMSYADEVEQMQNEIE